MAVVGVLNLDKPKGPTSAAVVGRLRRSSGVKRVGHGGTLDPLASGVLPIFFGRATVLADLLSRQGKSYRATIRFGATSTTDDAEGRLTPAEVPAGLDSDAVTAALAGFKGSIQQRPPGFSAIKVAGERSYRRARAGEAAALPPREVLVDSMTLASWQPAAAGDAGPAVVVEVSCGPGFYVRSLARDLGEAVGTAAYLESLVRTGVGPMRLQDAISLEDAEARGREIAAWLSPPSVALAGRTAVDVDKAGEEDLRHGRAVAAPEAEAGDAYAVDAAGRVLALGHVSGQRFRPRRLVELA
ncbi:MAG TPA: tRNA pseudouridine(55) synthase TruB [Candidatus Dormibacteraeota bacterium]|jgi:tRNA pseudouridine55 synthase|nr:tRNA pseudouridine(55) synthase TruB [Candidatus Dormibacteraeota bacterium]